MKRLHSTIRVSLIASVTLLTGLAAANEIYKWTDDDGTVHYGDRPTGATAEERVPISSDPTDPARVQQIVTARNETLLARQEAAAKAAAEEPTKEELRAEAKQRAEKCTTYKERLQKFVTSRRLYRHDENGERVYLDEEQTLAERARVQAKVEEYCKP